MISIVTGAAGFAGYSLTDELLKRGHTVYAVVRPNSVHNKRLKALSDVAGTLHMIELDCENYAHLHEKIKEDCDIVFHLSWFGGRYDMDVQMQNIGVLDNLIKSCSKLNCRKIVVTGSQAEYGPCDTIINEEIPCHPIDSYGTSKLAAMYLSKQRANEQGLEWVWGRIFSLYGKYEPIERLLPNMVKKMLRNEEIFLTSCEQYWDYLDVRDAANAIIALGEYGKNGEIYNIANGDFRKLEAYVKELLEYIRPESKVNFGERACPFYSLQPNVEKIKKDTGWVAEISFSQGIKEYVNNILEMMDDNNV